MSIPHSGTYKKPAKSGLLLWHRFHYQKIKKGFYLVRSLSGSGVGPNPFDKGTVFNEEELYRELIQAGAL